MRWHHLWARHHSIILEGKDSLLIVSSTCWQSRTIRDSTSELDGYRRHKKVSMISISRGKIHRNSHWSALDDCLLESRSSCRRIISLSLDHPIAKNFPQLPAVIFWLDHMPLRDWQSGPFRSATRKSPATCKTTNFVSYNIVWKLLSLIYDPLYVVTGLVTSVSLSFTLACCWFIWIWPNTPDWRHAM